MKLMYCLEIKNYFMGASLSELISTFTLLVNFHIVFENLLYLVSSDLLETFMWEVNLIMEVENHIVILWVIIVAFFSLFLIGFIIRYIHNKPPINITLVDLIYCDFLLWMFLVSSTFMSAVIGCHLSPRYVLIYMHTVV